MLPFLALLVHPLKGNRKLCTCDHIYVFFFFFYIIKQKGNTKMKRNSLNLLCFIPTYFQEMYIITVTTMDRMQQKPPYHSSCRRFSGSGFSGSFLNFLVLVLLVIDGFDDSGFAGFSLLVLLVLALLVLGGGFSRFSSSSGSSSKSNRNLRGQRHNLSISLFSLSFSILNQSTTNDANHTKEEDANNSNLSFRTTTA